MLEDHRRGPILQRPMEGPAVDEIGRSTAETGQGGAGVRCCVEFR